MNYSKKHTKVTKGVRRLVFLLVFSTVAIFSYGLVAMLGIHDFKPAYLENNAEDEEQTDLAQIQLTETVPLFAKMRIGEYDKYNSTTLVE